ncbi:MAG: hypothetical protein AAB019_08285 [Planctomycetota bacterium]
MATIISKVQLMIPLNLTHAPNHMVDQWQEGLKSNAARINIKRKLRIPDEATFKNRLAQPAATAWAPMIDQDFESRSGKGRGSIVAFQRTNLSDAFESYNSGLEHMFETVDGVEAKRFKERVDNARERYNRRVASRTLPFTGEKTIGKSVVSIAPLWLTRDPTVEGMLRAGDEILAGGPVNIVKEDPSGLRPAFKAALAQFLLQSGVRIVMHNFNPTQIVKRNDQGNMIIAGFQSADYTPFATGGDSHCDWVLIDDALFLEIQVSTL